MALVRHQATTPTRTVVTRTTAISTKDAGESVAREAERQRRKARTVARQQQAAERVAAATAELSSGITESLGAAKQLSQAMDQIAAGAEEAGSTSQHSLEAMQKVSDSLVQAKELAESSVQKSAAQMAQLGEHYQNLLAFNQVTMGQMGEWNRQMTDRVIILVGGIQFQDIVRQRVEQVINALNRRQAHADAIVEKLRTPDKDVAIERLSVNDLFRDYVMEDQRRVHTHVTGGQGVRPVQPLPAVELF